MTNSIRLSDNEHELFSEIIDALDCLECDDLIERYEERAYGDSEQGRQIKFTIHLPIEATDK